ncbi:MAG TPA: hypothetical protein VFT45_28085, partial [Longimicrobium sp.]|nr:hypothetical protein [Longimicrobium sp.]
AAALRALAGHTARVRADMEMEPDAAVRALEQRLRTAPPPPPPAPPSPPGSDSHAAPGPSAPPAPADADAAPGTFVAEDQAAGTLLRRTETGEPVAAAPPAAAPVRRPRGATARWGPALAVAALLLVLAAAALMPSLARGPAADAAQPAERYDPRRIAVLYFDDQSPRGDLGYLAAGLTGALIDQLGGVPALQVVSRNGVKAYRDGEMSFDSLVARLRVGSVVEGSVQRAGDSVRVTVQLVDTNADKQLESRTVIRHAGDLFALEESVGEEVSGFLRRRLGREVRLRQAAGETRSAQALDLFFRAEAARDEAARMARRGDPLDEGSALRLLARADTFLAAAEAADPTWARPSVTRGLAALTRATLVSGPARGALHRAAAASASRALALAPGDAAALTLRGRVKWRQALDAGATPDTGRVAAAERDLRAAVEADSSMASAWAALSQLLRVRGQLAESDLAARRALAADAWLEADGLILTRLYFTALGQGDFPQAREWCQQGRAHFPADWRFVECSLTLARNDPAERPDPARAWALLAELDRLDPPARAAGEGRAYARVYRQAAVAAILARAGKADSARAVLARAREEAAAQSDGSRVAFLYDEAFATLLLGDRAGARRLLDAYVGAQPALRPYVAREPAFRGLFAP